MRYSKIRERLESRLAAVARPQVGVKRMVQAKERTDQVG